MSHKITPIIQSKQSWQDSDCLFCRENAEFEAFARYNNIGYYIRCCESVACQSKAKELVIKSILSSSDTYTLN